MRLIVTDRFRDRIGNPKKFWGCPNYPICRNTHGAHPDGRPLGRPATKEVRELRTAAHRMAEKVWGVYEQMTSKNRQKMYQWLKANSNRGHFAKMHKDELLVVMEKMATLIT